MLTVLGLCAAGAIVISLINNAAPHQNFAAMVIAPLICLPVACIAELCGARVRARRLLYGIAVLAFAGICASGAVDWQFTLICSVALLVVSVIHHQLIQRRGATPLSFVYRPLLLTATAGGVIWSCIYGLTAIGRWQSAVERGWEHARLQEVVATGTGDTWAARQQLAYNYADTGSAAVVTDYHLAVLAEARAPKPERLTALQLVQRLDKETYDARRTLRIVEQLRCLLLGEGADTEIREAILLAITDDYLVGWSFQTGDRTNRECYYQLVRELQQFVAKRPNPIYQAQATA